MRKGEWNSILHSPIFYTNLVVLKYSSALESSLVNFKIHHYWVHSWPVKSEALRMVPSNLWVINAYWVNLKFSQYCIVYWTYWLGLQSTTLVTAILGREQSHMPIFIIRLCQCQLLLLLCIYLEALECIFIFILSLIGYDMDQVYTVP